jgi:hypothetical protein
MTPTPWRRVEKLSVLQLVMFRLNPIQRTGTTDQIAYKFLVYWRECWSYFAPKRKLEVINQTYGKDTPLTGTYLTCSAQLYTPLKKHLTDNLPATNVEVKQVVDSWLKKCDNDFLHDSLPWWATCLNVNGDYVQVYTIWYIIHVSIELVSERYFCWNSVLPW